jgi:hypothetical protein
MGIKIVWYGINIPTSINVKRRLLNLNLYLERMKPFRDPIRDEITTAGIVMSSELAKLPFSAFQAAEIPLEVHSVGKFHIVVTSAPALDLKEALSTT